MYDIYTTKNKSAGFVGECQIDKYTISDALIITVSSVSFIHFLERDTILSRDFWNAQTRSSACFLEVYEFSSYIKQ